MSPAFLSLLHLVRCIPDHFNKPVSLFADINWWVAEAAGRLVIAAAQRGDAAVVCWLCKRKEAKRMHAGSVAQVLHWVIAQQEWKQADGRPGERWKLLQRVLRAVLALPGAWPVRVARCCAASFVAGSAAAAARAADSAAGARVAGC
jgi:hypothetical protein